MRIFLDVGAHTGETVEAVLDPDYRFDRIYCFEPVPSCCLKLERFRDPRVVVCRFGLWNATCYHPIFAPGTAGGSVYRDKSEIESSERCKFVRASEWFQGHVTHKDLVFMKLNCEGSECDILDDLIDSGEISKVDCVMIDFDVRKISSQRHREKETITRLKKERIRGLMFCEEVMRGPTHQARIQNWLRAAGADDDRRLLGVRRRYQYIWQPMARRRLRRLLRRLLVASRPSTGQ